MHDLPGPAVTLRAEDPAEYLGGDEFIQTDDPRIKGLAADLRVSNPGDIGLAKAAYEWVRDNVRHSWDARDRRVTVAAIDALEQRTGLCYVKSHLLAALLRAEGIPAGLCYQRVGDPVDGFALHGLVAVYLNGGWHRQDPRGNKPGVDAQFSLDREQLAWYLDPGRGEVDYPQVYIHPAPTVITALKNADDVLVLCSGGLPQDLGVG